jgi:hypothetical protein
MVSSPKVFNFSFDNMLHLLKGMLVLFVSPEQSIRHLVDLVLELLQLNPYFFFFTDCGHPPISDFFHFFAEAIIGIFDV